MRRWHALLGINLAWLIFFITCLSSRLDQRLVVVPGVRSLHAERVKRHGKSVRSCRIDRVMQGHDPSLFCTLI
jgi:hypothetical protein